MYRRYTSKPNTSSQSVPQPRLKPPHNQHCASGVQSPNPQTPPNLRKKSVSSQNPLLGLIPSSLYNPESQKVLGLFSAEDLLIAALIFLLLENDEENNKMLIYALVYILISDYIDLPF